MTGISRPVIKTLLLVSGEERSLHIGWRMDESMNEWKGPLRSLLLLLLLFTCFLLL
jgi:hypothetical protein